MCHPELVKAVETQYGKKVVAIKAMNRIGNRLYRVTADDGVYVLKQARPAFARYFESATAVVDYLSARHFPTPAPLSTVNGQRLIYLDTPQGPAATVLLPHMTGRTLNLSIYGEKAGRLIGQLHEILSTFSGPLATAEPTFYVEPYLRILADKGIPASLRRGYADIGHACLKMMQALPQQTCHRNLHGCNLIADGQGMLWMRGFDYSCHAPRLMDLAMVSDCTDYYRFQPEAFDKSEADFQKVIRGYSAYHPVSVQEQSAFGAVILLRHFCIETVRAQLHGLGYSDLPYIEQQYHWLSQAYTYMGLHSRMH